MVIEFFHFVDRLIHNIFHEFYKIAVIYLGNSLFKVLALGRDIFAVKSAREFGDLRVRYARGTTRRTNSAHNAVETLLGALFVLAALSVRYILHYVKTLRTSLGAGVATYARINFGVKLHHYLLGRLDFFYIVHLLYEREERQRSHVHTFFYALLTGKAGFEFLFALYAVNRGARAAKTVSATATAHEFIPRVFHCFHYGKTRRHFVFLTEKIYVYFVFHIYTCFLFLRRTFYHTSS
mgnify:FL=1